MEKRWIISKLNEEGTLYLSLGGDWERQQKDALTFYRYQAQTIVNVLDSLDDFTDYDYQEV